MKTKLTIKKGGEKNLFKKQSFVVVFIHVNGRQKRICVEKLNKKKSSDIKKINKTTSK